MIRYLSITTTLASCVCIVACGGSKPTAATVHVGNVSSHVGTSSNGPSIGSASPKDAGKSRKVIISVGGHSITKGTFEHWMAVGTPQKDVPQPPNYTACIALLEKAPEPIHKPKISEAVRKALGTKAQLKEECQERYQEVKLSELDSLIASEWVTQEAADLGSKVSDSEVKRKFKEEVGKVFHTEAELQASLKAAKETVADLLLGFRMELAAERIRAYIKRTAGHLTPQQALIHFVASWRKKWVAKTDCRPGFVVQKCRQFKVTSTTPPEDPSTLN